jgi:poly-gamma-glutamate synthesis protein (capsule biosynthesis protein)
MQSDDTLVIGAVGDVHLGGATERNMLENGFGWPFEHVRDALRGADVLFGNLESVFVHPESPKELARATRMAVGADPEACVRALAEAGFSMLSMANNHVLDAGTLGATHTKAVLEAQGIGVAGFGRTQEEATRLVSVVRKGRRVGLLCYAEDSNYTLGTAGPSHASYRLDHVLHDIRRHRNDVDILLVSVHADLEFLETPSLPRYRAAREMARAGAGLVLMHHPHVPQGVERVDDSLVAYSLGNFVYDAFSDEYVASGGSRTSRSFILLAKFSGTRLDSFEQLPVIIQPAPEERPHAIMGSEATEHSEYLRYLNGLIDDASVVGERWRETVWNFARSHLAALTDEDFDWLVGNYLPRLLFVEENRVVLEEFVQLLRERFQAALRGEPLHQRPEALLPPRPRARS